MEQTVDGIVYRYSSEWIHKLESQDHWMSYRHQLHLILPSLEKSDSILEIGPGSGFLSNYLKSKGYRVTTLDIDSDKHPDIIANLIEYPFVQQYDHILAFEVFEHIPFEKFTGILPKLKKATSKSLFISVPGNYRIWIRADMVLPVIKKCSFTIRTKRRRIIAKHHFWELGYRKFTRDMLKRECENAGFKLKDHTRYLNLYYFHYIPSN